MIHENRYTDGGEPLSPDDARYATAPMRERIYCHPAALALIAPERYDEDAIGLGCSGMATEEAGWDFDDDGR